MKPLDPAIKAVSDRIYNINPAKFKGLIVWIRQAQKYQFATPIIIGALLRFEPYAKAVRAPWYPYLDRIIKKVEGDFNMGASRREHEQHKDELKEAANGLLKGLVKRV